MYQGVKFFAVFFSFLLLNGCASSCGSSVETNSNGQTNEIIIPKKADNASIPNNANANMVNGVSNTNNVNPTLDESKVKVINPETSKVEPPKKKMPDNSEMSAKSVGATFVETRQFLKHPQLDRLERIIEGRNIKLKIYLKDGKTYDLEESKLKDYKNDSAATILKAVGVNPVEAKDQNAEENSDKVKKKPNS